MRSMRCHMCPVARDGGVCRVGGGSCTFPLPGSPVLLHERTAHRCGVERLDSIRTAQGRDDERYLLATARGLLGSGNTDNNGVVAVDFEAKLDPSTGRIVDFLTSAQLIDTPEERIRQRYLKVLHYDYGYPLGVMRREVGIVSGSSHLLESDGSVKRADIVVYLDAAAANASDQGRIKFVVECKRPTVDAGYNQLVSYIFNTSAGGGVWYNGDDLQPYVRRTLPHNALEPAPNIPAHNEDWSSVGARSKQDLRHPQDIRGLLRICNNKLHGRGIDAEEEDLTMDMVRILLAKIEDEILSEDAPKFFITSDEYSTADGKENAAERVRELFRKYADQYPDVFDEHENIKVSSNAIAEVIAVLQEWRLLAPRDSANDWDLMGAAYEQYTATHLKRARGQFFTNRLITEFMVEALDAKTDAKALDPAGGSGGFITAVLRRARRQILDSTVNRPQAREPQLDQLRKNLALVEISPRLVKIAKTAMLLNGDGHAGMTRGNSLGPYTLMDPVIQTSFGRGSVDLIVTNPPFAGVGDGQVTDPDMLAQFELARRWYTDADGDILTLDEYVGRPPEMLFLERCIDWLKPGGLLGIVMPKGFLETTTYRPARELLFRSGQVLAVVTFHKNSFQPDTGVRTCALLFRKFEDGERAPRDYPIFMAISQRVGRDSEGRPIFKVESDGQRTEEIDEDLGEILEAYRDFRVGRLRSSEYRFEIRRAALPADSLNLNPQFHLPHLNETLRQIQLMDDSEAWEVTALGQLEQGITIFKGPRLRTDNIVVDGPDPENEAIEAYYTPSAILQDKRDSVKWLDVSRATPKQKIAFNAVRVETGDLLVTRSGTIGRVAYITSALDGAIVSDDAIRVRINDPKLRRYVFAYLQTAQAQDQLRINEYGSVQQHLEPTHLRDLLVPIPLDWSTVADPITSAEAFFASKERQDRAMKAMRTLESALTLPSPRSIEVATEAPDVPRTRRPRRR